MIEKGMMLLWSKGYNATSVKDIVDAAQVPKGSFYFYFDIWKISQKIIIILYNIR